jgi:hypothetical protein
MYCQNCEELYGPTAACPTCGKWGEVAHLEQSRMSHSAKVLETIEAEKNYEFLLPKAKEMGVPLEYVEWLVYKGINALVNLEKKRLLEYILSEPAGTQTMTTEQMDAVKDENWRDEVIQYFFNTESLRMSLQGQLDEIEKKED